MTDRKLHQRRIVLGISGGIAAYKSAVLCRELARRGAQVRVVMTENATRLVQPLTFATLTQHPVYTSVFTQNEPWSMDHISYARWGELLIVAPATANIIGKFAQGVADDALSTLYLAWDRPALLAPAMNPTMWANPAVQENMRILLERGVRNVGPAAGDTACGEQGEGRMAEPEAIADAAEGILCAPGPLSGRKVLITAGPTREYIDPVRFISNPSSGKMGFAVAEEALTRGAQVTLAAGPTTLNCSDAIRRVDVETAEQMLRAVEEAWEEQDVIIFSAAVGDYTPESRSERKIKKDSDALSLSLRKTVDIARTIGERAVGRERRPFLVGFAAETHDVEECARKKLAEKHFDLIVANDVGQAGGVFGRDENQAMLIFANGEKQDLPRLDKRALAATILDAVVKNSKF
ncbi:bifunctional phosphopantothenoylcysteine decarboxylase/phosphopantothenate--cysteine ligase CoaBC [Candidatus Sumerlaeota bacterium]|nr:bifunctional phosphopantothenoylcysteine decarboxylase/phosphopantothenate--cysteine ligase CoaBC [Candidatus Sumerlaeota bacterium]